MRNGVVIQKDNRRHAEVRLWGRGGVHNYYTLIKTQRVPLVNGLQMKHIKDMLLRRLNENFGRAKQRETTKTIAETYCYMVQLCGNGLQHAMQFESGSGFPAMV